MITKAFRRLVRPLLLMVCFVMAASFAIPTHVVQAAGYPSLTYIRFNRSGGSISATYCIAADSYQLYWGESSPSYWYSSASYGAIGGCTTKLLFLGVAGNETLFVAPETRSASGGIANYGFILYPRGSNNLTCSIDYMGTFLRPDPRLVSASACAFWDTP